MRKKIKKQLKSLMVQNLIAWITYTNNETFRNIYIDCLMSLRNRQSV